MGPSPPVLRTWHSAGMLWRLRPSDADIELNAYSRCLDQTFGPKNQGKDIKKPPDLVRQSMFVVNFHEFCTQNKVSGRDVRAETRCDFFYKTGSRDFSKT